MYGTKATFLDALRKELGFEYLIDYSGHGKSEGKIEKQLLNSWVEETKYFKNSVISYNNCWIFFRRLDILNCIKKA